MTTLKLEHKKKYVARNGKVHEMTTMLPPGECNNGEGNNYAFTCDKGWHYMEDGHIFDFDESEHDLVEEVK